MTRKRASTRDPKYKHVFSVLKRRIQNSKLGKLSEAVLMEEFGVGRNTVLKALDMLEADGFVRRVKGSGTFPVRDAMGELKSVNILLTDAQLAGLRDGGLLSFLMFSRLHGIFMWPQIGQCFVKIIFVRLEEPLATKKEKILSLGPKSGLIIPAYRGFEDIIEICRQGRFPYMTSAPPGMDFNSVALNHYGGAKKAIDHLVKHSHRRHILFLAHPGVQGSLWIQPRYEAYVAALAENGLPLREALVCELDADHPSAAERLKQTLASDPRVDAIFASSSRFFPLIVEAVKDLGIRVPADKAIVVYDDPPELSRHSPAITAVRTPLDKMGEVMVEKVVEMIDFGFRDDYRILLEDELVIRGSS
ncbi:MAG: GntR family transcriptional regulator [Kiritimatiellae bacterium]|nr:GntR family transcriptional regulator [Kiritimatiellia bacterium]